MSDFREELATVIVAELDRHVLSTTTFDEDPDCSCGWKGTPYTLAAWESHLGRSVFAAQEAHRQTVECPECGGTGTSSWVQGGVRYQSGDIPCPAGCIDGRVPGETRLAIVERAGWLLDGKWSVITDGPLPHDDDRDWRPVFLLAPDLPETEK